MNVGFIRAGACAAALSIACVACHHGAPMRPSASATPASPPAPAPSAASRRSGGARDARATGDSTLRWRGVAQSLLIEGRSGTVHATPIEGDAIEITARPRGRDDGRLALRVTPHGDGVVACVGPAEPDDDGDGDAPCPQGAWRGRRETVDLEVGVPGTTSLKVRHVSGSVDVERLRGDVDVSTVSGSVHIETAGLARARAVNGSITARIGAPRWTGRLSFSTVNGSIDVTVPRDVAAEVSAHTVSGAISADGVTLGDASLSRDHLRGRLGSGGGGELEVDTVNGSITLRPAS